MLPNPCGPTENPVSSSLILSETQCQQSIQGKVDEHSTLCDNARDDDSKASSKLESAGHPMLSLSAEEDSDIMRLVECDRLSDASASESSNLKNTTKSDNSKTMNNSSDQIGLVRDSAHKSGLPSTIGPLRTGIDRPASTEQRTVQVRLLVRRREAGALIGKGGSNIKRLRETFRSSLFSIPDTGNGPERVVCMATDANCIDSILEDVTELLLEKSPENDEQIELKLLIHSSHAGSIIGIGGQSIKRLRNDSKAAIKIYEMCCPYSNERVCAIKAKPPVVVNTIKLIRNIIDENPVKGTSKPYDALHFDLSLVDKYGGYLPDDAVALTTSYNQHPINTYQHHTAMLYNRASAIYSPAAAGKRYSVWRAPASFRSEAQFEPTERSDTQDSQLERLSSNGAPSDQSGSTIDSSRVVLRAQSLAGTQQSSHTLESAAPINSGTTTTSAANRQANRFHPYHPYAELAYNRLRIVHPRASYHPGSYSSSSQLMPSNASIRAANRHLRLPASGAYICPQPMAGHYPLADSCQHLNPLAHRSQCVCMFMPLVGHDAGLVSPARSDASQPTEPTPFTTIQLPINNKTRPTVKSCSPNHSSKKK